MIIDGVEVLYTMRNGKIVDPNIPTEGLVCYLDTRGKNNTDIYRNTLLDLSGNGNHVTLQNFNFTEESGYVKDLSGGTSGLKFDGVDDYLELQTTNSYTTYTIIVKLNNLLKSDRKTIYLRTSSCLLYRNANSNVLSLEFTKSDGKLTYPSVRETDAKFFVIKSDGFTTSAKINDSEYVLEDSGKAQAVIRIGLAHPSGTGLASSLTLDSTYLYNRALTDNEITKLMEV